MSTQSHQPGIPEFGITDRLRKAREFAGLEQSELAERMEVARTTISNYETGSTTHHRKIVLNAWAMATGVPVGWLKFGEVGTSGPDGGGQGTGEQGEPLTGGLLVHLHAA